MVTTSDRGQLSRRPRVSRPTHWDEVDLKYECLGAGGKTLDEIGSELSVTREAVRQQLLKLGVSIRKDRQPIWFIKHYGLSEQILDGAWLVQRKGMGLSCLATEIGITGGKTYLVRHLILLLGLNPSEFRLRTPRVAKPCEMCGMLRTYQLNVIARRNPLRNGQSQQHFFCSKKCQGDWLSNFSTFLKRYGRWTINEDEFLRVNYQEMGGRSLVEVLEATFGNKRTREAIYSRAAKLGLKRYQAS